MRIFQVCGLGLAAVCGLAAQKRESQAASTFSFEKNQDEQIVGIRNSGYEVVGPGIPGLGPEQRLVLRKITTTKHRVDEIGMEASTTVQAWPLGGDLNLKPLYSVTAEGIDPKTVHSELLTISRGLEEVEWWTVYRLSDGQKLFDTYAPLVVFTVSRADGTPRYAGLEVPGDDITDTRLKDPHVIAVLTYASGARVIGEALITADDPKQAQLLRSFADASRRLEFAANSRALRLSISRNYPSAPQTVTITVPLARDDLDPGRAQAPMKLHVTAWKR